MFSELQDLLTNTESDSESQTVEVCQHPGCETTTREGKPYCSSHIENCDYIRAVIAEIARRDAESRHLDSGRWVADNAHLIREALILLEHGSFSAARLGHMLDVSERAADTLIRVMSRRGFVVISVGERGAITATKRIRAVT